MTEQKNRRVIISGGGTGGHIFPAISIANALKAIDDKTELLFVGAVGKMEMQKVPEAGYKIIGLDIQGIKRKAIVENFLLPWKLLKSIVRSLSIIREFKPDVVVGVGGYASGPLLLAARIKRVPYLIQEQNSYAGITNKWLAGGAAKICVAFEGMEKYFPAKKIMLTGNPVRKDLLDIQHKRDEAFEHFHLNKEIPTVLVVGGSLGAKSLCDGMLFKIDRIIEADFQIIWQTGKAYFERTNKVIKRIVTKRIKVMQFVQRMDLAYAAADLVVSRAGAGTISELCLVKKPVILIPSPNVAEDHQTKNAMALVKKHAAIIVKDDVARTELADIVMDLLKNEEKRNFLANNIAGLAMHNSAETIAKEVIKLSEKGKI